MSELYYARRDYTTILEELVQRLKTYCPEYTDFNHSSVGMAILRLVADTADNIHYHVDQAAQEAFIDYALERQSIYDLGHLVGYVPRLASPSLGVVTLTKRAVYDASIKIPAYSVFATPDGVKFTNPTAYRMDMGATSIDIFVVQGEVIERDITPAEYFSRDWSGRTYVRLEPNISLYMLELWEQGPSELIPWVYNEGLWRATENDRYFSVDLDGDTMDVLLVFGDGRWGMKPPESGLKIRYLRTLGRKGNVSAGRITIYPAVFPSEIACNNVVETSGGDDPESMDELREIIPRLTRTQRRGVTLDDYEVLIERVPGIRHCKAVDRELNKELPYYYIALYVVPEGNGRLSEPLRDQIVKTLQDFGHLGEWSKRYIIREATQVPINISLIAGINIGYSKSDAEYQATVAVENFLSTENHRIGELFQYGELYRGLKQLQCFSWIKITAPTDDIQLAYNEFPVLGDFTITIR